MMKLNYIILSLFFYLASFAQEANEIKYVCPEILGKEYYLNRTEEIKRIHSEIKDSLHNGNKVKQDLKTQYAYGVIDHEVDLVERNNIYYNFEKIENYLYSVIKKAYPNVNPNLKIYISKDPELNASNIDNILIVNIGLFNYINNEAELASILLHELGHNYYQHAFHRHIDWYYFQKKIRRPKIGYAGLLTASIMIDNINSKLIKTEKEADSFSMKKLLESNYDINAGINVMNTFEWLEQINKKPKQLLFGNFMDLFTIKTHPTSSDRFQSYIDFVNNSPRQVDAKYFLVDSMLFSEIKVFAYKQAFNQLIETGNYRQAIIESFRVYLSNPNDKNNIKYILKSLKNNHLYNLKIDNLFLSEYDKLGRFKEITNQKILSNVLKKYYSIEISGAQNLNGYNELISYSGTLKTYRDFVNYFSTKAIELNCEECYFEILLNSKSKSKKDSVTINYLKEHEKENITLKNYIENKDAHLKKQITYVNFIVPSSIKYKHLFSKDSNDFKKNEIAHFIPSYFKKSIEKKDVFYKNISSSDSLKLKTLEEGRKVYNSAFIAMSFEERYNKRIASNPNYAFLYRSWNKWYLLDEEILKNAIRDSIGIIKIFQIQPISIKYKKHKGKTVVKMLYYKNRLTLKINDKNNKEKKVIFYKKCIRRKKFKIDNPKILFKNDKLFKINI